MDVTVADSIRQAATNTGRDAAEITRQHVQEVILKRLSLIQAAESLVLRGGVLMKLWVGDRARQSLDLDFVSTEEFHSQTATEQLSKALFQSSTDDGVLFHEEHFRHSVIWPDTPFPGLRIHVRAQLESVEVDQQIDIGFHDPLIPPPEWIDYSTWQGHTLRLCATTPEINFAWKLQDRFEGHGWNPKHVYDLFALITDYQLDQRKLLMAIRTAFESRDTPLQQLVGFLSGEVRNSSSSRQKWRSFRSKHPNTPVPSDRLIAIHTIVKFVGGLDQLHHQGSN